MIKVRLLSIVCGALMVFSACKKESTETFERFYFRHDGADLAVQIDGNRASKTFILLLHGGPGGGSAAYNAGVYADRLEEQYAMVYMDQRGNGASQGNYAKSDLTLAQNSEDVVALAKFLKKRYGDDISLFLMGHSWGGMTSAHALIHTDIQSILKGWIEVDGAHDFGKNNIEAVKLFKVVGDESIAAGYQVAYWNEVLERINQIDTNAITDEDEGYMNSTGFEAEQRIEAIVSPISGGEGPAYGILNSPDIGLAIYLSNNFGNPILNADSKENPLTDRLDEITIPSLFLWGKYDLVVPPALGESALERVNTPHKSMVIFEHSGHSPMSNEPDLFVDEVVKFVELYK